jgi:hypothetical protein
MYKFILHCSHFHKMRIKNITSPEQFQGPTENIRCKDKTNTLMHVHDCALSWCNASTSIQSDEAKLLAKPPLSVKCEKCS